jgi:hypothetical protein
MNVLRWCQGNLLASAFAANRDAPSWQLRTLRWRPARHRGLDRVPPHYRRNVPGPFAVQSSTWPTWSLIEEQLVQRFVMRWVEEGGPPVQGPSRTGFGHTVIKAAVQQGSDADVHLEFKQAGFEWTVAAPAAAVVAPAANCG